MQLLGFLCESDLLGKELGNVSETKHTYTAIEHDIGFP